MPVSVQAELQLRKFPDRLLENMGYIIVELLRKRFGVHGNHCFQGFRRKCGDLPFDISEIRYRRVMVEFQCIGIQADETHIASGKCKIHLAEYLVENPFGRWPDSHGFRAARRMAHADG